MSLAPETRADAPAALIDELLGVTERLAEVLSAETALLRRPGAPDLAALARDKTRLAVRYDSIGRELARQQPDWLRTAPEAARLSQAVTRLDGLARDNARAIEIRIKANRQVLDLVNRAAREAAQPSFSYGTTRLGYGARSARNPAIAVNRVL